MGSNRAKLEEHGGLHGYDSPLTNISYNYFQNLT